MKIQINNKYIKFIQKFATIHMIKYLVNLDFKELKELSLNNNKISDIKTLEKVKFDKLEILYLNSNEIPDINILEYVNFKNLKELNL